MSIEIKTVPIFENWESNYINWRFLYSTIKRTHEAAPIPKMQLMTELPISKDGPWIAGGAARRMFTGAELDSDIDLFFKDSVQYALYEADLKQQSKSCYQNTVKFLGRSRFASNFLIAGQKIQLINFGFYENIQKMFESFDFTICHFACDGEYFYYTEDAVQDTVEKKLRIDGTIRPVTGLKRIIKYTQQGFKLDNQQIKQFFQSIRTTTPEEDDFIQNRYESDVTWIGFITNDQTEEICTQAGIDLKEIDFCQDSYDRTVLISFSCPEDKSLFKLTAAILYPEVNEKKYD